MVTRSDGACVPLQGADGASRRVSCISHRAGEAVGAEP